MTAQSSKSEDVLATVRWACRRAFLAAGLFSLGVNLLMLTVPLYMLQIFDRVLMSRSLDTLLLLTIVALVALLTLALLDLVRSSLFVRLGHWMEHKLSGYMLGGAVTTVLKSGYASVQSLRDLSTVRTFLSGPGMVPLLDIPWTPIFLAVIFMLHPMLGWIALGGALVLVTLAMSNELVTRRILLSATNASIEATQAAEAAVQNADVIEAMGMLPALVGRWHRESSEALNLQRRAAGRNSAISAFSKFLRLALQLSVLGTGAFFVIAGELTGGGMIAASILMGRALAPIDMVIGAWRSAVSAYGAYQRVKQQLARAPVNRQALSLPAPMGQLVADNVTFLYAGQSEPVLKNVSFALEPGESLGIVGPAAAGKTTLARLIVGNLEAKLGHIRLDGADVSQWPPEDRGQYLGYLPQDVELFSGTVRENISRMGTGDTGVIPAARLVGAHEIILGLPAGYETNIGRSGTALSGGQRQLIALARAVYGEPRLIVLDEPYANLDHGAEEDLIKALQDLKARGATVIVIAHRPNILQQVDKMLVLRHGQVHGFGDRSEVLPKMIAPAPAAVQHRPTG
jgi:PrtD family type I secretion system ABC transporter